MSETEHSVGIDSFWVVEGLLQRRGMTIAVGSIRADLGEELWNMEALDTVFECVVRVEISKVCSVYSVFEHRFFDDLNFFSMVVLF